MEWLEFHGYVLGRDQLVSFREGKRRLVLTALFVSDTAWTHAQQAAQTDQDSSDLTELLARSRRPVETALLRRPRGFGGRVCRCAAAKAPSLELRCMPSTMAPPLVCTKDGIIKVYTMIPMIELSIWTEAIQWRNAMKSMYELYQSTRSLSREWKEWAHHQLYSSASELNIQGQRIANTIASRLRKDVMYTIPAVHLYKL